ncbi:MAG TPA: hypothetical protein VFQ07_06795 [Candidatus Polarisedimenticolia bacterium]|nr:hypothetical protein [Candidatus Polarisedimenticolia bacterium]
MSQPFPSSGAPGEVSPIEPALEARRPCCPRCGDGELVDALVVRPVGMALWAVYCAGIFDRARRRLARRSCGYVGGTPEGLRAGANSSPGLSAGGVSVSAMRQPR